MSEISINDLYKIQERKENERIEIYNKIIDIRFVTSLKN